MTTNSIETRTGNTLIGDAPTERDRWARERLLESLDAYQRGLAEAPIVQKFAIGGARDATGAGSDTGGPITFVASDETEDRLGDVLRSDGWDLEAYRRNPVFLWAHDYTAPRRASGSTPTGSAATTPATTRGPTLGWRTPPPS